MTIVNTRNYSGNNVEELLIGYTTMSVENITIIPGEQGVEISNEFLPFINPEVQATAPIVSNESSEEIEEILSNVAERSLENNVTANAEGNSILQLKESR